MDARTFESQRLDFFSALGVELTPRRLPDRRGGVLYTLQSGERGPPVLVLHGGGSEASEWGPLMPHLPRDRRWILVDRPGHGLSSAVDHHAHDLRRLAAEFLEDLLDGLGLAQATFLANSLGAFNALCLALARPSRVERLVLIGAPAGLDRRLPGPLRLLGTRGLNRLVFPLTRNPTPARLRKTLYALLTAHPERVPQALLETQISAFSVPGYERSWRTLLEVFTTPVGVRPRYLIRDEVATLLHPVRFVWGERDAFAPPESGEALAPRMADAAVTRIPDAGHLPWLDEPRACARAVEAALVTERGVARAPGARA